MTNSEEHTARIKRELDAAIDSTDAWVDAAARLEGATLSEYNDRLANINRLLARWISMSPYADDRSVRTFVLANPAGAGMPEIGAVLGVTRERVRQIISGALGRLSRRHEHDSGLAEMIEQATEKEPGDRRVWPAMYNRGNQELGWETRRRNAADRGTGD